MIMGAGAGTTKAFPTPGAVGTGLGSSGVMQNTMGFANLFKPTRPAESAQPLKALSASAGTALQPGQAPMAPTGQTPYNPWGSGRGGNGLLPIYRRPGTMPGS